MKSRILVGAPVLLLVLGVLALLGFGLTRPQGRSGGFGVNQVGMPAAPKERPAPEFATTTFDGRPLRLADLRGQVVVLNFWASWCPPCRAEARDLERVWQAYRDRGVVFLGVNIQDTEPEARAFLQEFGITYANVRDTDSEIAIAYLIGSIPTTFFIDREGRIASRWIGSLTEQQLAARVEELLD